MRSKAIFMALLALVFGAQAVPVSPEQAKGVARAWARRSTSMRGLIGETVESVSYDKTANGAPFYAVKMVGGGTVFTSGATEIEPVIAYTSSQEDFSKIDRASPLWALLNKDLSQRHAAVSGAIPLTSDYVARRLQRASANRKAWAEAETSGSDESFGVAYAASYAEPIKTGEPSDIRVSALMKTKWSQGDPYNLFTPNHYVCGCVATALAQFLRYNHGPVEDETGRGIPQTALPENEIKGFYAVDGDNNTFEGTVTGGLYAWDKMPTSPDGSSAKDEREEIGRLLFDLGIMLNMSYAAKGSGAYTFNQSHVLVDHFSYKQAAYLEPIRISESDTSTLEGGFFSNFDAGSPVLMSIPGHAIVGDGYGYENGVPYVHLNFGWAGQSDFWYNLPDMTAAGAEYNAVDGINLNCFANEGGITEAGQILAAALTGRVLDEDGQPVEGCAVSIRDHETGAEVNVISGANGVWAAILAAGTYDLHAKTEDGQWMADADEIRLDPPTTRAEPFTQVIGGEKDRLIFASDVGNSWGNDLVLEHPSVRIGDEVFSSLDKAIAYGHRLSETSEVPVAVTMEIIDSTFLKKAQEIDFDCTIVATNEDPFASTVNRGVFRKALAALTVTNGVTVTFSNVVFTAGDVSAATNAAVPVIHVRTGGTGVLAGVVEFGVPYDAVAVFTEAADGLALVGPVESGFNLACSAAKEVGKRFASVRCDDFEAVSNSAARIANAYDPYGEIRGQAVRDEGTGEAYLVWTDTAQIPLEDAAGYYVDAAGVTNTRARVDRLFEKFAVACTNGTLDAKELVVLRPGALARPLTIGDDVTIRGAGDGLEIDCTAADGFTVTNGLLTVDGLAFTGYRGNALFLVNGGDLVLTNAVIDGAVGTNKWSGAVAVVRAGSTASLLSGTVIRNCEASGKYSTIWSALKSYGGGVYVGAGATSVLDGCTITNCTASTSGGGVYAELGTSQKVGGTVRLAGATVVRDNFSGTQAPLLSDDILIRARTAALVVDGSLAGAGTVGVKYGSTNGDGNGTNDVFAALSGSRPAGTRFEALFNDTDGALEAVVANGAELVWSVRSTWKGKDEPFPGALVKVANRAEGTVYYYSHVEDAFDEITGDSDVTLLSSDLAAVPFARDLEVRHAVTLTAEDPSGVTPYGLCRADSCSIRVVSGGSLTIVGCYVYGCELEKNPDNVSRYIIYDAWWTVPLLLVDGGELTLEEGAGVGEAFGMGSRSANAVTVWNGGTFTMKPGSEIFDSENTHDDPGTEHGWGGGLLVDGSTARLEGGSIWYCNAVAGGGVFIGNKSTVYVSGDLYVGQNINWTFYDTGSVSFWNDLVVSDDSTLVLDGPFEGSVGYTEGNSGSREVFGEVGPDVDLVQAAADATNFWHNMTHARGVLATSTSGKSILVWADAFDKQSDPPFVYTDENGEVFTAAVRELPEPADIDDPTPEPTPQWEVVTNHPGPIAFKSIARVSDTEWTLVITDRVEYCNYRLIWTDDLTKGFTSTGAWEQAVGTAAEPTWTTNVITTGGAWFWRAEGADGTNMVLKTEE